MRGLTFRIGSIPVRVDASFWIIMGLFGLQRAAYSGGLDIVLALEWVAMVFAGILWHELGHAVAFRSFGREPQVTLYAMGGLTSAEGRLTPGRRLVSTLAGPGVGLALGAIAYVAMQAGLLGLDRLEGRSFGQIMRLSFGASLATDQLPELLFLDLLFINIGWGILNLVPLYPLDGGQSLEALLDLVKVKAAARITSIVSILIAAFGGYWAATNGQFFLLLIAFFLGLQNVRRLGALRDPAPVDHNAPSAGPAGHAVSPQLQRTLAMAEQALGQGRNDEAVEMVAQEYQLRPGRPAAQALAAVLARTRRFDDLERLAEQDHERLGPAALSTIAAALVAGGRYERALQAAEGGWNTDPDGHWQHAVTAAAARAGLRDIDGAVHWLYMATDRGWTDQRRLEADPVFAEVRSDPRLGDIIARMGVQ